MSSTLIAGVFFGLLWVLFCVLLGIIAAAVPKARGLILSVLGAVTKHSSTTATNGKKLTQNFTNHPPFSEHVESYTNLLPGNELIHYGKDGYTIIGRTRVSGDELIHYDKTGRYITGRSRRYE